MLHPYGVGKPTFIKIVLRLMAASSGEVRVLGGASGQFSKRIGYLLLPSTPEFSMRARMSAVEQV